MATETSSSFETHKFMKSELTYVDSLDGIDMQADLDVAFKEENKQIFICSLLGLVFVFLLLKLFAQRAIIAKFVLSLKEASCGIRILDKFKEIQCMRENVSCIATLVDNATLAFEEIWQGNETDGWNAIFANYELDSPLKNKSGEEFGKLEINSNRSEIHGVVSFKRDSNAGKAAVSEKEPAQNVRRRQTFELQLASTRPPSATRH